MPETNVSRDLNSDVSGHWNFVFLPVLGEMGPALTARTQPHRGGGICSSPHLPTSCGWPSGSAQRWDRWGRVSPAFSSGTPLTSGSKAGQGCLKFGGAQHTPCTQPRPDSSWEGGINWYSPSTSDQDGNSPGASSLALPVTEACGSTLPAAPAPGFD